MELQTPLLADARAREMHHLAGSRRLQAAAPRAIERCRRSLAFVAGRPRLRAECSPR